MERQLDILPRREGREQIEALEDEAEVLQPHPRQAALRQADRLTPVHLHTAAGGLKDAAHDGQQRRFAAPRRAHQHEKLAGIHVQVHAGQRVHRGHALAVCLVELSNLDHVDCSWFVPLPAQRAPRRGSDQPRKTIAGSMVVALRMEMMDAPAHIPTASANVPSAIPGGSRMGALPPWLPCDTTSAMTIATA